MRVSPVYKLLLIVLSLSTITSAQLELPRVSQKASLMQTIGLLEVTLNYSRPNVKGRKIWGGLVPYNQVWRTGADEATTILFSEDCRFGEQDVPAGKYSLFSIPGETEWTIILNKVNKQWGAFNYDSTKDLLRFTIKPEENQFTESMNFYFNNTGVSSAVLNLVWEQVKISIPVEFNTDAKVYSNIKKAIESEPDNWVNYAAGANYAADNNIHLEEANGWIDKSIELHQSYYNYYVKAKLLKMMNNNNEALRFLERAIELGKSDPEFKNDAPQINLLLKEFKSKN